MYIDQEQLAETVRTRVRSRVKGCAQVIRCNPDLARTAAQMGSGNVREVLASLTRMLHRLPDDQHGAVEHMLASDLVPLLTGYVMAVDDVLRG